MKAKGKRGVCAGVVLILVFALWTFLVLHVDVQPVGQNGTNIGFASVNTRFHALTGVHMGLYTLTDWLGLVPIAVCLFFGAAGFMQMIRRKSLLRVDADILLLGVYYIAVILAYLVFEMVPVNYRPIPIDGVMEASYPSSTTLLVLSVMPTLAFQANRRAKSGAVRTAATVFAVLFSAFMAVGRLVSGVHWLTDILGAVWLSAGLYLLYRSAVILTDP